MRASFPTTTGSAAGKTYMREKPSLMCVEGNTKRWLVRSFPYSIRSGGERRPEPSLVLSRGRGRPASDAGTWPTAGLASGGLPPRSS